MNDVRTRVTRTEEDTRATQTDRHQAARLLQIPELLATTVAMMIP